MKDNRDKTKLKPTYVPLYDYFAVDGDRFVGVIHIRIELTSALLQYSGNIEYGINPKYLKQGYGTELLRFGLLKSQELINSENVLLTCDDDNIGSYYNPSLPTCVIITKNRLKTKIFMLNIIRDIIVLKVGELMFIYDLKVKNRSNEDVLLESFKGKVLVIVNTATGCGFTPQYEGLEKLYNEYHDKGLEILDFPCNQFGNQAPGTDDEIHEFCTLRYNTSFDQFAKIEVNGEKESPLYTFLKNSISEDTIEGIKNKMAMKAIEKISQSCKNKNDIKWNFTKFLVDRNGNVVGRYSPTYKPEDMEDKIKELI